MNDVLRPVNKGEDVRRVVGEIADFLAVPETNSGAGIGSKVSAARRRIYRGMEPLMIVIKEPENGTVPLMLSIPSGFYVSGVHGVVGAASVKLRGNWETGAGDNPNFTGLTGSFSVFPGPSAQNKLVATDVLSAPSEECLALVISGVPGDGSLESIKVQVTFSQ